MTRILAVASMLAALVAQVARAQQVRPAPYARNDGIIIATDSGEHASGDIALAALQAKVRIQQTRRLPVESERGLSICADRGKWKCIVGGAALGFVAGALVGSAMIPKEVTHEEYGCGFFGCGYSTWCDAHCEEPVTKVWAFGFGGAVLGGIGGYYIAKVSSQ